MQDEAHVKMVHRQRGYNTDRRKLVIDSLERRMKALRIVAIAHTANNKDTESELRNIRTGRRSVADIASGVRDMLGH